MKKTHVQFVPRHGAFTNETWAKPDDPANGPSIKHQLTTTNGATHIHAPTPPQEVCLLTLYNVHFVDFVRLVNGVYQPVLLPKHATHQLRPTRWNTPGFVPSRHEHLWKPAGQGYALAVCAEPLVIRPRKTKLKAAKRLSKKVSSYLAAATLAGKRAVLKEMLQRMKVTNRKQLHKQATTDKLCDALYVQLRRADRLLRAGGRPAETET